MSMDSRRFFSNLRFRSPALGENGFTLIEIIATLVIISILAAVVLPRYIEAETSAKIRGLEVGVSEINGRETLTWALVKLSNSGYLSDAKLWDQLKVDPGTDLGADYDWPTPPGPGGGVLRFRKDSAATVQLIRDPSKTEAPARWHK